MMNIEILISKKDKCCGKIEHELHELSIGYSIQYIEEHPELVEKYHIAGSPSLVINGQLAFSHQPNQTELLRYFSH